MSAEDVNIGRLVASRYRLDDVLGRGGFGSVYKGWDIQIGRDVAVKLLDVSDRARSLQQTAELRERFRREAMAAGRINHRGVVTIYDFGVPEDGGEAYLVMELLEGRDLSQELAKNGPMAPDRAQRLFIPILEGLGRGHDLGIIHKDIKPQNVFLTHPGTNSEALCLVDFGVARVVHEDKLTMTGLIVGTPQYMTPEYITDALVTPALDVYQMALILVEVIAGKPAVPANESFIKSCNRHFTGDLEIPAELLEGEFGRVLQMALSPNPKDRLPNAMRFAELLAEVDPSTIVMDSSSTMVFERAPVVVEDRPSLFPPMRPEEVSAELERVEQSSGGFAKAGPDTPLSIARAETIPPPAQADSSPVEVIAPPVPTIESAPPKPAEPRWAVVEPPPATAPEVAPARSSLGFVAIIAILLAVGAGSVIFGLSFEPADPIKVEPLPPSEVAVVEPTAPSDSPVTLATSTTLESSPTGARILAKGVEIGRTPASVAIGQQVELELDGYKAAVVEVAPGLGPVALEAVPPPKSEPRQNPKPPSPRKKPFKGRVFDPEEADPVTIAEDVVEPQPPAKFERTVKDAEKERWDKPKTVPVAP